jgi:hypothetical protein
VPPEQLAQALAKRPFEPFRLHLLDGSVYDVRRPGMMLLDRHSAYIGITTKKNGSDRIYDRLGIISLIHVARLEPISATSTSES